MCIPKKIAGILGYKDKAKTVTKEEMLEYFDSQKDDKFWEQYNIISAKDCKGKASYVSFREYLKELGEKRKLEAR